jgi:uncharacterized protein with PIN domain
MYPSIIADSMLGNIAKKLRIFGFDTLYAKDIEDKTIMETASITNRIILTRDKQLHNSTIKKNISCILLYSEKEIDNFIMLFDYLGIKKIELIPNEKTRCSLCNEKLISIPKSSVTGKAPKKVFDRTELFFECSICHKAYWTGKHVKDINYLIELINNGLRYS